MMKRRPDQGREWGAAASVARVCCGMAALVAVGLTAQLAGAEPGSPECPAAPVVTECPDLDHVACTVPVKDSSGNCTEIDTCTEICRPASYWGRHAGVESGGTNLVLDMLEQTGPPVLCRHMVTSLNLGKLDSMLEALCVQSEGDEKRQLFRELAAAALNCTVSEGGRCDDVVGRFVGVSFDACNQLCAGEPYPNQPTAAECIRQLKCFNDGGRLVDGLCALGTCKDGQTLCGSEYGECAKSGGCHYFEDSCAATPMCSEPFGARAKICADDDASESSADACQVARGNACTIDTCP